MKEVSKSKKGMFRARIAVAGGVINVYWHVIHGRRRGEWRRDQQDDPAAINVLNQAGVRRHRLVLRPHLGGQDRERQLVHDDPETTPEMQAKAALCRSTADDFEYLLG